MKRTILLFLFTLSINTVFADSPLTSTNFYQAYLDVPMVKEATVSKGKITTKMMEYIHNENNPLEIKLAIINAIGFNFKGLKNSQKFLKYVLKKKKYKLKYLSKKTAFKFKATADELICYAYMKALDNYFNVTEACNTAKLSLNKNPNSFGVAMIYNLIKADALTSIGETCYGSQLFLALKDNPNLKMDMRKESMSYIFEYIEEIGKDCKTK
jgi:hypothetical protein